MISVRTASRELLIKISNPWTVRDIPRKGYTRYVTNLLFKRSDQNIEITCQNNYVLREKEMAGEGRIVFVSFWFFVRNFKTSCDVDCIKNITYDLFFLKNA